MGRTSTHPAQTLLEVGGGRQARHGCPTSSRCQAARGEPGYRRAACEVCSRLISPVGASAEGQKDQCAVTAAMAGRSKLSPAHRAFMGPGGRGRPAYYDVTDVRLNVRLLSFESSVCYCCLYLYLTVLYCYCFTSSSSNLHATKPWGGLEGQLTYLRSM